jgi:spore germination cell wall hydrolase CwlJ-like protein
VQEETHPFTRTASGASRYEWLTAPPAPALSGGRGLSDAGLAIWSHWRILCVLLLLAAPFCYAMFASRDERPATAPSPRAAAQAVRPIPSPFAREALRPLSRDAAQAWNDATPLATTDNPAAPSFLLPLADMTDYQRSMQCMTMAVYYEAGNEPTEGERAVAQVVLNRLRHPVYPKTVCGVVFEGASRRTGCQFTFACDGSMARKPNAVSWRRAELVAAAALAGYVYEPVGMATHYHANYVVPYWAATLDKVATIGAHIFYRWKGRWGLPQAFVGRYAGKEPALSFVETQTAAPELTPGRSNPVIVKAADRPVIAASSAPAGPAGGRSPDAVSLDRRWIVPRDEAPSPTAPPTLAYAPLP